MAALRDAGISISLFLDPDPRQIDAAAELRADAVELHTGRYALARGGAQDQELDALRRIGAWYDLRTWSSMRDTA